MSPWSWYLADIGESDCEQLGDGLLAQPVNALTSIAYAVIGVFIVVLTRRLGGRRGESILFGLLLVGVGVGSVLFHGPQPTGSKALHDLPILLAGLLMLLHDVSVLRPTDRTLVRFAVVAPVVTVAGLVAPGIVSPLAGLVLASVAVLEVVIFRTRRRPVPRPTERRLLVAMVTLVALGGASWVLGRSGAPLCDPDTVAQPHGLWHLLSGLVFGAWWWLAYVEGNRR
jgi:hypothetical protein